MAEKIKEIPVIAQSIYVTTLDSLNHKQIKSDLNNYGIGVNQDKPQQGWISRGFVQYEDIIVPVTPEIKKMETEILSVMADLTGAEYEIRDMWAVSLLKNQSVIAHSHHSNLHAYPSEYFSVVYYPEAPTGSAELIFMADWCGVMQKTVAVTPESGMLIIFNSYMTHMTARHRADDQRLVVSMNLAPKTPNITPNADWSAYWDRPMVNNPIVV